MSISQSTQEIHYPESDGRPLGETEIHRRWMIRIFDLLEQRYRGQRVYVGSDLLLYYEQGKPKKFVVPDVFVVKEIDLGLRRTYQLWNEGAAPNVVIEVTSRATRKMDEGRKPDVYAQIGVKELFLYDPMCDYLNPPLRGYRLQDGKMVRMPTDDRGCLVSLELGVGLYLEETRLVMEDVSTGVRLATEAEVERAARTAAEARADAAEEEIARLREQLRRRNGN